MVSELVVSLGQTFWKFYTMFLTTMYRLSLNLILILIMDHNLGTAKQIIANIEIEDKMIVQNFKNIWPRESEIRA
jgi:hypothetical protein